jgi:hypothetical protein
MTNAFLLSAKKKLQACYHMQDFGQLLKYVVGDDGDHGVYYDYKQVLQIQLFLEKQIYQNNKK